MSLQAAVQQACILQDVVGCRVVGADITSRGLKQFPGYRILLAEIKRQTPKPALHSISIYGRWICLSIGQLVLISKVSRQSRWHVCGAKTEPIGLGLRLKLVRNGGKPEYISFRSRFYPTLLRIVGEHEVEPILLKESNDGLWIGDQTLATAEGREEVASMFQAHVASFTQSVTLGSYLLGKRFLSLTSELISWAAQFAHCPLTRDVRAMTLEHWDRLLDELHKRYNRLERIALGEEDPLAHQFSRVGLTEFMTDGKKLWTVPNTDGESSFSFAPAPPIPASEPEQPAKKPKKKRRVRRAAQPKSKNSRKQRKQRKTKDSKAKTPAPVETAPKPTVLAEQVRLEAMTAWLQAVGDKGKAPMYPQEDRF